jgi:excisionase family DNA binding protein
MNKITTKPEQANPTAALHTVDSRSSRSSLITVKDAARRLNVSASTVYRFDRKNGHLTFVADGRRIFIENVSFEDYLAKTGRNATEPDAPADDVPRHCPQEEQPAPAPPPKEALVADVATPNPLGAVHSSISSCGQRELILPRRYTPGILCYQSFIG